MTANGTVLPSGGGVLVALGDTGGLDATSQDVMKTGWMFVDGGKSVAPVIKLLAPGLALYEPPAGTTEIKLTDGKRVLATHPRSAAKPLLAAPVVTSVDYVTLHSPGPRRPDRDSVTAQLTGARPDGAVAVILFAAGKPASWTSAFHYAGPKGPIELWHTADRCETPIPGITATPAGTKVTVAWVDSSGRIGAMSKEIVVVRKGIP